MWLDMDNEGNNNNRFSANFFSLQLQLKTLLEDAGGDDALALLDTLTNLNKSEQKVALKLFSKVIQRVTSGPIRLETEGDLALKEFEDNLYEDLVAAIEEQTREERIATTPKIEVLSGGRELKPANQEPKKSPIDIASARKKRRERRPSLVN